MSRSRCAGVDEESLTRQVDESPTFPTSGLVALQTFARYLQPLFNAIGFRVNRCLPKDGSEGLTPYTVATRPAASSAPGALIYVSDAAAGAHLQFSHGGAWINVA